MRLSPFLALLSTATAVSPRGNGHGDSGGHSGSSSKQHTIWLCGDSTMAPGGGHNGTEGWGQYVQYSFDESNMRVNNSAYAGRSARTFTREGRFQRIIDEVIPGDWVVMEFGHNDGGDPYTDVKYRVDCPGMGNETCPVTYNNQTEVVQTYVTYLQNASSIFLDLGASVIISPPTPNNPYEFGDFDYVRKIYTWYAWYIVDSLGGPENNIYYVDHGTYCAQALELMGADQTNSGYPMDHTHTAPFLADVFARAWILGVKCGTAPLQADVVNATSRIEGDELGTCLSVNATLPI